MTPEEPDDPTDAPGADDTTPGEALHEASAHDEAVHDDGAHEDEASPRDPLLDRAERIGDLPLHERAAAFDGLNRAVVAELQSLEEA